MGGGDIKMMAMVGAFLGMPGVLLTIFLGALLGSVIFGPISFKTGKLVPFGIFLAAGAAVTYGWGDAIIGWYVTSILHMPAPVRARSAGLRPLVPRLARELLGHHTKGPSSPADGRKPGRRSCSDARAPGLRTGRKRVRRPVPSPGPGSLWTARCNGAPPPAIQGAESSRVRLTTPGTPATRLRSGISAPSSTTALAPITHSMPMRAFWRMTAFMPTTVRSPISQLSNLAPCPTVTCSPMRVGAQPPTWITQLSCTLVPAPTMIPFSGSSPRSTAPNQMLASSPTVTSPTRTALGAMKAVSGDARPLPVEGQDDGHQGPAEGVQRGALGAPRVQRVGGATTRC